MTENLKKFLEAVSENRELAEKVGTEKNADKLIAIAEENGLALTKADFAENCEISDDELDTVAGGSDVSCACAMGGGGTKDKNDKTCACVMAGVGYDSRNSERCLCGFAGYGYDT